MAGTESGCVKRRFLLSLPWMLLGCKVFSRDTLIILLICSSGNALGFDDARMLLGESLGYGGFGGLGIAGRCQTTTACSMSETFLLNG